MQLVCKDSNQQESMVKELEHENGDTNFFLADPGNPISFISTWMFSSWSIGLKNQIKQTYSCHRALIKIKQDLMLRSFLSQ